MRITSLNKRKNLNQFVKVERQHHRVQISTFHDCKTLHLDGKDLELNEKTLELLGQFKNLKELDIYHGWGLPHPDKVAYIKERLKKMLPKTEIRLVGWRIS